MSLPTLTKQGQALYDALEPLQFDEVVLDFPLAKFCQSLGMQDDEISVLAADWGALLDVDRTPAKALGWLGQFIGVKMIVGLTDEQQRDRIRNRVGQERGTLASLVAEVQTYLTGTKQVMIKERDTSAYHFDIRTRESQTPPEDWPVTNLVQNPSFETGDMTGWTPSGIGTFATGPFADTPIGLWFAQAFVTSGSGNSAIIESTDFIPVTPSLDYILTAYFNNWSSSSPACAIRLLCYDAASTPLGFVYPNIAVSGAVHTAGHFNPPAQQWQRNGGMYRGQTGVSGTGSGGFIAGTTKVKIQIFLFFNVGFPVQVLLDGIQLEQRTTLAPFVVGSRVAGAANILQAIARTKSSGLQFLYSIIPDWTYDDLDAAYATYNAIDAAHTSYDDIDAGP